MPILRFAFRRWRAALAACLAACGGAAALAMSFDALDTPAAMSDRATSAVLLAVKKSGSRLFAVGERGIILLSTDHGRRWQQVSVPTSVTLTNLSFSPAGTAWVVGHGGVILHASAAGLKWRKRLDGRQAASIELAAATKARLAGRLAAAERLSADGPDKPFFDIHFWDEDHGLVVGAYGLIFSTSDGGASWHSLMGVSGNPDGKHLYAIGRAGNALYIAGEQGLLLKSSDFGQSFKQVELPYKGTLFGMLGGGDALMVYGLRGNAFAFEHGASAWTLLDAGMDMTLTSALATADGALVVANETGRLSRRPKAGARFEPVPMSNPSYVAGMAETRPGHLVLVGPRGIRHVALANQLMEAAK